MNTMDELIRCRPWIEAALEYSGGTHDFLDVAESVMKGTMQLWAGPEGCAVTEMIQYPKKKVLHVFLAGGKKEQIIDFQESALQFAQMNGCDSMTLAGRAGWKRVLDKHGWEEAFTVLELRAKI